MEKWARVKYFPCLPLGEDGRRVTACKEHIEISRKVAGEGMVLLKNNNNVLPLKLNQKIAVFGKERFEASVWIQMWEKKLAVVSLRKKGTALFCLFHGSDPFTERMFPARRAG